MKPGKIIAYRIGDSIYAPEDVTIIKEAEEDSLSQPIDLSADDFIKMIKIAPKGVVWTDPDTDRLMMHVSNAEQAKYFRGPDPLEMDSAASYSLFIKTLILFLTEIEINRNVKYVRRTPTAPA